MAQEGEEEVPREEEGEEEGEEEEEEEAEVDGNGAAAGAAAAGGGPAGAVPAAGPAAAAAGPAAARGAAPGRMGQMEAQALGALQAMQAANARPNAAAAAGGGGALVAADGNLPVVAGAAGAAVAGPPPGSQAGSSGDAARMVLFVMPEGPRERQTLVRQKLNGLTTEYKAILEEIICYLGDNPPQLIPLRSHMMGARLNITGLRRVRNQTEEPNFPATYVTVGQIPKYWMMPLLTKMCPDWTPAILAEVDKADKKQIRQVFTRATGLEDSMRLPRQMLRKIVCWRVCLSLYRRRNEPFGGGWVAQFVNATTYMIDWLPAGVFTHLQVDAQGRVLKIKHEDSGIVVTLDPNFYCVMEAWGITGNWHHRTAKTTFGLTNIKWSGSKPPIFPKTAFEGFDYEDVEKLAATIMDEIVQEEQANRRDEETAMQMQLPTERRTRRRSTAPAEAGDLPGISLGGA